MNTPFVRRCTDCRHPIADHLLSEPGMHGGCVRCVCGNEFAGARL